jgi:HNH endonuclease
VTGFAYPKTKHIRRETPPKYRNYSSYRPFLQREFQRRCVYCQKPDSIVPGTTFGIDHYKPKHRFPQVENDYSNLYYCCGECNSRKGAYWPESLEAKQKRFIPNPCDHAMWDHMRFVRELVYAQSPAGEFTVELLDLNDPKNVSFREFVLVIIAEKIRQLADCELQKKKIKRTIKKSQQPSAVVLQDLKDIDEQIDFISGIMVRLSGA